MARIAKPPIRLSPDQAAEYLSDATGEPKKDRRTIIRMVEHRLIHGAKTPGTTPNGDRWLIDLNSLERYVDN